MSATPRRQERSNELSRSSKGQETRGTLRGGGGDKPSQVYIVWSNHDYDLGPGLQAAEATRNLLGHLNNADINVVEHVADYSPQWGGWRGQHDEILAALFPAAEADE